MKGNENKPRIGVFGRCNYGKSTFINFVAGQQVSLVSDIAGTTTDPVRKTMELIGVGPIVWVDTPGLDDQTELGPLRTQRSWEVLPQCDLAILLVAHNQWGALEEQFLLAARKAHVPMLFFFSRLDIQAPTDEFLSHIRQQCAQEIHIFNPAAPNHRDALCQILRSALPENCYSTHSLLSDIIGPDDHVLLVTPIDSAAPQGRMILPQVQVLRDILDNNASATFCKETQLQQTLNQLRSSKTADGRPPLQLVITDSQVFPLVADIVPQDIPLTSFSVVLARAKGPFADYLRGTPAISSLKDGDRVLMLESCSHDITCEDIGRVKLPRLLQKFTGKQLQCQAVAGLDHLPYDINDYALVIQCGGCVATPKQLAARLLPALIAGIPVTNYGLAIAYTTGIFHRAIQPFAHLINQ